ncbi:DUF4276 family protein [Phosphitispora fastidiosa]|uniref:DUF4276 family protein n=1 Tax=Phosphitispora fastidiosa TaxID=2837202 RepID=UPI001E56B406|nr:DUF4276 family protein [Phosphitispora fastidiosa]MBU7005473.1 hypothetical protein [Phosphitispora fastidiosa]
MKHIVFLLEEISMKAVLDEILPSILPDGCTFHTIKHEGKTDMEKSIPRKLRAYRIPEVQFVVLRDQDNSDCKQVKQRLLQLCFEGGRTDALVRVVCHELESWFLGDLSAVEKAFNYKGIARKQEKAQFRNPDKLANPCEVLQKMVPEYQKYSGSKKIAKFMKIDTNCSLSFNAFIEGIRKIVAAS